MQDSYVKKDDSSRYARKLSRYISAANSLSETLQTLGPQVDLENREVQTISELFLPSLINAFNAELAFYADEALIINSVVPEANGVLGKRLPVDEEYVALLEEDTRLTLHNLSVRLGADPSYEIRSLMIMQLETPWGRRHVAVCNTGYEEGFLSEDEKYLQVLIDLLSFGFRYGHKRTVVEHRSQRYIQAIKQGAPGFISRASEDLAAITYPITKNPENIGSMPVPLDDLLADYLDAELNMAMRFYRARTKEPASKKRAAAPFHILDLIAIQSSQDGLTIDIQLVDNPDAGINGLLATEYPRTLLAIIRICLWSGFLRANRAVPAKRELHDAPRYGELSGLDSTELFWVVPDTLFGLVDTVLEEHAAGEPDLTKVDYLRTSWLLIFLLAQGTLSSPDLDVVASIREHYRNIYIPTAKLLRLPLEYCGESECLEIDSDWLLTWLVSNTLLSKSVISFYGLNRTDKLSSPATATNMLTFISNLCVVTLYAVSYARHILKLKQINGLLKVSDGRFAIKKIAFADIFPGFASTVSEAQLYVISEYAYNEIGVNRELSLFHRLARQLRNELPLHAASSYYRDHLYHVMDVCLLGELLLRSVLGTMGGAGEKTLTEYFSNVDDSDSAEGKQPQGSESLLRNWYVAALCHDLGYVVEKTTGFLEPVKSIDGPGLNEFWERLSNGLTKGYKSLRKAVGKDQDLYKGMKNVPKMEEINRALDHGIVSWLHLQKWIRKIDELPEVYADALVAIYRHNLHGYEISIKEEPLTFLLILCDHLQEWGRARIAPDPLSRSVVEMLRFAEPVEFESWTRVHSLRVVGLSALSQKPELNGNTADEKPQLEGDIARGDARFRTKISPNGVTFMLEHTDAVESNFEPALSWLHMCRDFQALSDQETEGGLAIKTSITMKHAQPKMWEILSLKTTEMDLLQDYATEKEHARYLLGWVGNARGHQKGVAYEHDPKTGVETFTIHVDKLSKPLSRGLEDQHWKDFQSWKLEHLRTNIVESTTGVVWPR